MKICLLGVEPTNSNLGVRALTAGSIACILHQYPAAEISLLDYGKEGGVIPFRVGESIIPLRRVNIRFSKKLYAENHIVHLLAVVSLSKLMPTKRLRRALIQRNPWLRHIDDVDLVASIAGGDSFSEIYGLGRLLYVSLPQMLVLWGGKRLILLPQTLGPFKSRFARVIAKYILKRAEAVYSRDREGVKLGAEMLGSNGSVGKVRFCYDVGFVIKPTKPKQVDIAGLEWPPRRDRCLVGLNISGLLFSRGHQWSDAFGLRVDYRSLVHTIVESLIRRKNAAVVLIPHVLWPTGEGDPPACEAVYKAFKDRFPGQIGLLRAAYDQYNQNEIKYVIGQCDFFVGARMHACIAALSQSIPAVAVAYSDKFIGVLQTVGVGELVADPRTMDEEQILNAIGDAFDRRATLRRQLEETIPGVKEAVLDLFKDITTSTGKQ